MTDKIFNEDCLEGMKRIPDKSVDLVITDPPYLIENQGGGFWAKESTANHYTARGTRKGMEKLNDIKDGVCEEVLDELCRVMKRINIYVFCSQKQIPLYIDYFVNRKGCNWNLLLWHKINPIPACGNKYLNDTEYILFFREKGVKLYGTFETKRTFYTTLRNQEDNEKWGHPTCKPVGMLMNFVENSSKEGDLVLDPFIGSGSTAIACIREHRHYMGFEVNEVYFRNAQKRINSELMQPALF